jgi:hypothetical protein
MADTTHLLLPLMAAAQAQKHVTHNDALLRLDGIVQLSVKDRDLTAPPASPSDGDRYIPASGATGAWAAWDLNIAWYVDGVWTKLVPREGWRVWIEDEDKMLVWNGGAWVSVGATAVPGGMLEPASMVMSPVAEIWRADASRTATPRTATLSSLSGDVMTMTAAFGHDFGKWTGSMEDNAYVRVWNMGKSPAQAAWVKASPASNQLQVTNAGDIASWANGDTIRIGDPNPTGENVLQMFAVDISPYLQAQFGAVFRQRGVSLAVRVNSSGGSSRIKFSATGATGSAVDTNSLSDGADNNVALILPSSVKSPISDSNLVFMSEHLTTGTALTVSFARISAVLVG